MTENPNLEADKIDKEKVREWLLKKNDLIKTCAFALIGLSFVQIFAGSISLVFGIIAGGYVFYINDQDTKRLTKNKEVKKLGQ